MLLNKTSCICGKNLKGEKFDKYIPKRMDDKFYGGRVCMTGEIKCECGRELKGYFSRPGINLELIDLEVIKDIEKEITPESEAINNITNDEKVENSVNLEDTKEKKVKKTSEETKKL